MVFWSPEVGDSVWVVAPEKGRLGGGERKPVVLRDIVHANRKTHAEEKKIKLFDA